MIMNHNYRGELARDKKIIDDIKGIIVRSSHSSFPDGAETHCIYEIQKSGEGKYVENDVLGKQQMERFFSVPTMEVEKFCLRIIDIMHRFDRVDIIYDDCCVDIELLFSGGRLSLPRGMAFKRRYVEDAWVKFKNKIVFE